MSTDRTADQYLERLRSLDPARDASVEPHTGPRAAALMEQIMQTDPTVPTADPTTQPSGTPAARPRRRLFAALGAVAVVGAGVLAFVALRGDDPAPTSVTYALAAPNVGEMCINIDGIQSDPAWIGFRGTVVSVADGTVTLDVTQWYRGGDAAQVVLTATDTGVALEGGTDFQVGADMLVGVQDGTTLGCGISGPYSDDLAARYATWFA